MFTALAYNAGRIGECSVTPDAYWTVREPLRLQDGRPVPVDDHALDRRAAGRRVRDGVATAGDHAQPDARPCRSARPRRHRRAGDARAPVLVPVGRQRSRARPTPGCSAAASSSPRWRRSMMIAAVTHRYTITGRMLSHPSAAVDRHPLVRAVPLPLADLPDHPQGRRRPADAGSSSWARWRSRSSITELSYRFLEMPIRTPRVRRRGGTACAGAAIRARARRWR